MYIETFTTLINDVVILYFLVTVDQFYTQRTSLVQNVLIFFFSVGGCVHVLFSDQKYKCTIRSSYFYIIQNTTINYIYIHCLLF